MNCTRCGNYQAEGTFCARCGGDLQAGNATPGSYEGYGQASGAPQGYPDASPQGHAGGPQQGYGGGAQQGYATPGSPYPSQGAPGGYGDPGGQYPAYAPTGGYPGSGAQNQWGGQPPGYAPQGMYGYAPAYPESRHLATEGHLLAMGFWHRAWAILGIVACVLMLIGAVFMGSQGTRDGLAAGMGVGLGFVGVIGLGFCFLLHWLGVSLQRFADVARIVSGALVCLGILGSLVSGLTSLGGAATTRGGAAVHLVGLVSVGVQLLYQLWMAVVLFSKDAAEVCSPTYKDLVARTPQVSASMFGSPFFWGPIVIFIVTFAFGFLVGFSGVAR